MAAHPINRSLAQLIQDLRERTQVVGSQGEQQPFINSKNRLIEDYDNGRLPDNAGNRDAVQDLLNRSI
jgi:hypothetical protein